MMMRRLATLFFLSLAVFSFGQEKEHKRLFQSIGLSAPFVDWMKSPVQFITYPIEVQSPISTISATHPEYSADSRLYGLSLATFSYGFRYNILELSENKAIGISAIPAIGLSFFRIYSNAGGIYNKNQNPIGGYGNFTIPILLEYEFGAGATADANLRHGGMIGIGLDYTLLPLSKSSNFQDFSYFQFAMTAGYRFKNKHDKVREINFLMCLGSSYTHQNSYDWSVMSGYTYEARLSWVWFLKS
jgi:hypothetical protein